MQSGESALTSSSNGDRVGGGRGRRSWSAPACTARHLGQRVLRELAEVALPPAAAAQHSAPNYYSKSAQLLKAQLMVRNPRLRLGQWKRLAVTSSVAVRYCVAPASTESSTCDVAAKSGTGAETPPAADSATPTDASDAPLPAHGEIRNRAPTPPLRCAETPSAGSAVLAKLDAATSQIALLNAANEQTRRVCAELEEGNTKLRSEVDKLRGENARLRDEVAKRDEVIDEQLHLICELQRQVSGYQKLASNNSLQ